MTNLTEQWKKGELPEGMYYIKYIGADKIDYWFGNYWEDSWNDNVEEVLAPVPTFDEYKQLIKFLEEFNALDVAKENQQLKELLKDCYKMLAQYHVENSEPSLDKNIELLTKIDNVIGEKK